MKLLPNNGPQAWKPRFHLYDAVDGDAGSPVLGARCRMDEGRASVRLDPWRWIGSQQILDCLRRGDRFVGIALEATQKYYAGQLVIVPGSYDEIQALCEDGGRRVRTAARPWTHGKRAFAG